MFNEKIFSDDQAPRSHSTGELNRLVRFGSLSAAEIKMREKR